MKAFHIVCEEVDINDSDDDNNSDEDEDSDRCESEGGKSEDENENIPALCRHTTQIYKNNMYVYGGRRGKGTIKDLGIEVWSFDLSN